MKKLLLLALLPASMLLQGCDDETVAAGVGFAGGVIVGSSLNDGPRYRSGGYYTRCTRGYGYYGRSYRSCRRVYRSYYRYNEGVGLAVAADQKAVADVSAPIYTAREEKLATRYGMSFESARKVVTAFDRGAKKDFNAFASIGVSRQEMQDIYEGREIAANRMDSLARALDMSPASTRAMLKDVTHKVQAKRAEMGR